MDSGLSHVLNNRSVSYMADRRAGDMNQGDLDEPGAAGTTGTDEKLSRLFAEIQAGRSTSAVDLDRGDADDTVEQPAEAVVDGIVETLFSAAEFRFDENLVKQNLDEILVLLIAMRRGNTNGKTLMSDLTRLFDSQLSPGTVYPALHRLENDGVLEMFELVRSKEYRIEDSEAAAEMVREAARQHLALGAFFYATADEL